MKSVIVVLDSRKLGYGYRICVGHACYWSLMWTWPMCPTM